MGALPSHLYLAVRDVDDGSDRGDLVDRPAWHAGAPWLPESWWGERTQRVGVWWVFRRPSTGEQVAIARANALGGRGLYAVVGPLDWLESLASGNDEIMPAREAWRRRAEDDAPPGEASPRQICRAWRWYRVDCTERATQSDVDLGLADAVGDPIQRDGVRRRLLTEGHLLPDPTTEALPWDLDADGQLTTQAQAVIRVRAIHRPVLAPDVPGVVGKGLHVMLESEPDRGT